VTPEPFQSSSSQRSISGELVQDILVSFAVDFFNCAGELPSLLFDFFSQALEAHTSNVPSIDARLLGKNFLKREGRGERPSSSTFRSPLCFNHHQPLNSTTCFSISFFSCCYRRLRAPWEEIPKLRTTAMSSCQAAQHGGFQTWKRDEKSPSHFCASIFNLVVFRSFVLPSRFRSLSACLLQSQF